MDKIYFTVNGENYTLSGSEVSPTTSLNDYLRYSLQLFGTKAMCHEGGCGACVVSVSQTHPATKEKHTFAVNSCLVHVLSCHQWDITTVEGLGNRKDGYHAIQSRLAAFNGTQCGYCTPGWVMNMHSLYEGSNAKLTTEQVERSFGGNICRCTGYRPILDAFKSFATDADPELKKRVYDLEDLDRVKCAQKCEKRCSLVVDEWCVIHDKKDHLLQFGGQTSRWYKAFTLQDVFQIGSIGGNLAMKNAHREFPSDIFLFLETIQAAVTLMNNQLVETNLGMQDFLKADLKSKIITRVKFPPLSSNNLIRSYKIMPRAQNALAIVNSGFFFKVDSENKLEVVRLVYSPISVDFVRASETEQLLVGKELFSEETLKIALQKLSEELMPEDEPPLASPACRKAIALGLFYKAILSLCPKASLNPRYVSGGSLLQRGVSKGTQTFDTDKTLWPLNKPMPKVEALTQCSGEVKYACDVASVAREVHVAFVLSTICVGEIVSFDASEALKIPGVVAFFTAADIPGKNTFIPTSVPGLEVEEELLASKNVSYYGQPVALIAAVSRDLALSASELVKVTYKKSSAKPVLTIEEALVAPDKDRRVRTDTSIPPTAAGDNTTHTIKGSFSVPSQYHFTLETQSARAAAGARGVRVRASTQWLDLAHVAVATVLGIQQNKVEIEVERLGGGYGGKASRSAIPACAAALVAYNLNRTASVVMPLAHNMAAVGKRQAVRADYELGVNNEGVIQHMDLSYYSDCGFNFNDTSGAVTAMVMMKLYEPSCWGIKAYSVLTDKAGNTWCRSPGTTEAIAIIEHIMERIAHVTKKDPIEVRIANLAPKNASMKDMVDTLKKDSNYTERKAQIATYNSENAWKKKGLKFTLMSYPIEYVGGASAYYATVSVYHGDGTVAISHSGIEMGQGINTKVAQVCAYTLKIPLEKVSILGTDSFISPNAIASGGSVTSDVVAHATIRACNELLARLQPVREKMEQPEWEEVIAAAYNKGISLQTSFMTGQQDSPQSYDVFGACACEVELDVLTGQQQVLRVDLLEDVGISMSPDVDVGQIEGAFMMGLGLWSSEQLQYAASGRLLSARTWEYHPPGARDIPADLRLAFTKDTPNPKGVLRSKATGEPALTLAVGVAFALHEAVRGARREFGYGDEPWLDVDTPYSTENILKAISPKIENFKLK